MNILLINPWIYDFAAYDLWAKPLGLLYIGSALEKSGHNVRLVDCMDRLHPSVAAEYKCAGFTTGKFHATEIEKPVILKDIPRMYKRYGIPVTAFYEEIERTVPDLIIVTSHMTYWYPGVFEAIRCCKNRYPHISVLLGGIYTTLCKEHAHTYSGADYIVSGAAIARIIEIAALLSGKKRPDHVSESFFGKDIRPAYHLYPKLESVSILTSLGCPYTCSYCASRSLHMRFQERIPLDVFEEILDYSKVRNVKDVAFYDDALLINAEKRFIPLADMIAKEDLKTSFHTPNGLHVRNISAKVAESLFKTGVKTLRLSFESVTTEIQALSNTKTSNTDLIKARDNLLKADYINSDIEVYLLAGLPGQTKQDVIDSINFVHDSGLVIKLALYSPIPMTPEFEKTKKEYPFIGKDPLFHNNTVFTHKAADIYAWLPEIKLLVKRCNAERK